MGDITAANGTRNPDFTEAQREFRMAFVIMHPDNQDIDFDDYLVIEDTREELAALWESMVENRATLVTALGRSSLYELNPSTMPAGIAWEPEITGTDGGCRSSIAAGSAAATLGLLLPVAALRRRRRA
jgi:hypothetical protein